MSSERRGTGNSPSSSFHGLWYPGRSHQSTSRRLTVLAAAVINVAMLLSPAHAAGDTPSPNAAESRAAAKVSADITLEPIRVSEHVYYFSGASDMASAKNKGFMSNAGFVVTPAGVVIFDSLGTPALGHAMMAAIQRVTDQPVKRVIVSHYHADHVYGLQVFQEAGAEIWAHEAGRGYLNSDIAQERLEQRRADLAPWVDENTRLVPADRWLEFKEGKVIPFEMGGMHFRIIDVSGAHSPDDIMLSVDDDKVLFAGDLYFTGRIPFVDDADTRAWLAAMDEMLKIQPDQVIPGHGAASDNPKRDMQLTRDYLLYLRKTMGDAVENMTDFEDAFRDTDWSRFKDYPAFEAANRINAYGQYLQMERESLGQ